MTPILNQGQKGQCMGFAVLACLIRMKPGIDHVKISAELMAEKTNLLTPPRAEKWFVDRGYIKGFRDCKFSPFLLRKQPIISGIASADWITTGQPPYLLSQRTSGTVTSHWFCIVGYEQGISKIANSWGEEWGDNGYFYSNLPISKLKGMFTIVL